MTWTEKIGKIVEPAAKFLQNGAHAQQPIPSQHRLFAALGMFIGWWALDKIRDIIFGMNQISEGEYEEIKREDVPLPLRFLHKIVDWNPHSDAPEEQWKKLAHQLIPAIGAGLGTVAGSTLAFQVSGREQKIAALKNNKGAWAFMDAEDAAQHAQSGPLRVLTAFTGGFSAASMMPLIYGAFLNTAFASANGTRIFSGNLATGNVGPAKAFDAQHGSLLAYVKSAYNKDGKINEAWAKGFVEKVFVPLFGKKLDTPEAQAETRKIIQKTLQEVFDKYKDLELEKLPKIEALIKNKKIANVSQLTKDQIQDAFVDAVATGYKENFGDITPFLKELNLDVKDAKFGNANPAIRGFHEALVKMGIVSKEKGADHFKNMVMRPPSASGQAVMAGA